MTWDDHAACRGMDQAIFFPEKAATGRGGDGLAYREARRVCARCPVRTACLSEAMADEAFAGRGYRYGMRGGMSPDERVRLACQRVAA